MSALPLLTTVPCELEEETKIALAGMGFVIVTLLAVAGPLFVAVIVNVALFPTTTGVAGGAMPRAKSIEFGSIQQVGSIVVKLSDQPPRILPAKLLSRSS